MLENLFPFTIFAGKQLSIPVFRGLILLVVKLNPDYSVDSTPFNPRFQGTHFVSLHGLLPVQTQEVLSIPVFRGLILLGGEIKWRKMYLCTFNPRFQGTHFVRAYEKFKNSENISFSVPFR